MAVQLLDDEKRIEIADSALEGVTGGDPETTYVVRQIPPAVNREIAKRHTKPTVNRATGQREQIADHTAILDDMLDYALVSWSGIQLKGVDAPCTRDNKLLLDHTRKVALIGLAGLNEVKAHDKADSFRSPA